MNPHAVQITKASGQQVSFSEKKLKQSLLRSGAGKEMIDAVFDEVKGKLYKGISTKKIHKMAFALLKRHARPFAARYKLKAAIMELGPSGFPFEKYVAEIFKYNGYKIKVGEIVMGRCIQHEIDVIAEKPGMYLMIECKYHHSPGIFCDVKIPLYLEARFRDVETARKKTPGQNLKYNQGWVVTNTKFSADAVTYGTCAGLHLIGWNFPEKGSLNNMIEQSGLYPLTCLTSITKKEKEILIENNKVLCREICENQAILKLAGINETRFKNILGEALSLCKGGENAYSVGVISREI
jgi:hypothetical protein